LDYYFFIILGGFEDEQNLGSSEEGKGKLVCVVLRCVVFVCVCLFVANILGEKIFELAVIGCWKLEFPVRGNWNMFYT